VLLLLPPSEGKAVPPPGPPVDLAALVHPELTARREQLCAALARLVRGRRASALTALGLSAGQAGLLELDRDLLAAPAVAARTVYTGVLYQYLDVASLTPAARRRAAERVLVASALWGVVRLEDRIPAYRLAIGARLPRLGGLAAWWRPALAAALPADALVVDLRSQGYAAMWRPAEGAVVEVRAFTERAGARTVVTHMAKATRGEVARELLASRATPRDPEGVATVVERSGRRVELGRPARAGAAWTLDVILAA
jgi:cytoplasmic iron level regulating protein YaaA (DUF328/UPF0246 family)